MVMRSSGSATAIGATGLRFILLFGVVSLFADRTY